MSEEMRVKYLFIDLKYRAYAKLQIALITALIIGAVLCFLFTRDYSHWIVKNAWWICAATAVLEVIEFLAATGKARKESINRSKENL